MKSKKDADEKRRLQELRDKELISKADVLKERIMGRRKTKKNVSRLAEAGMKAGSPLSRAEIEFESLEWIDLDRTRTALTLNTVYVVLYHSNYSLI